MGQDLTIVRIAARLSRIVRGPARVADRKPGLFMPLKELTAFSGRTEDW
jgi:hypothetical protein